MTPAQKAKKALAKRLEISIRKAQNWAKFTAPKPRVKK